MKMSCSALASSFPSVRCDESMSRWLSAEPIWDPTETRSTWTASMFLVSSSRRSTIAVSDSHSLGVAADQAGARLRGHVTVDERGIAA